MQKKRIRFSILAAWLGGLILFGTVGYRLLLDVSWISALYMTVITVSTVGYGEVGHVSDLSRIFSVLLIFTSIGIVGYVVSSLVSYFFEGNFQDNWRKKKMQEQIEKMENHYIVCGSGETGHHVIERLMQSKLPFLVIDHDPEAIEFFKEHKVPYIAGDATLEEVLQKAHIDRAKGLVATLSKDSENLYVVLTARDLNPDLTIIAKAINHGAHQKLKRAGATNTVSPTEIGGHRIASMLLRPAVIAFLDTLTQAGDIELDLEDVRINPGSELCGLSLRDARIPEKTGLIILAIKSGEQPLQFNPQSTTRLSEGDHLYALGQIKQIDSLKLMCGAVE